MGYNCNNKTVTLAKVSNWNLFWVNQNYSDSLRYLYSNQSETKFSIHINAISDWSKPNFQSESIRIIPTMDSFGLILIENSVWINPRSDWFGLIWIENLVSNWFGFIRIDVSELIRLSRIDFWPFFIKQDRKSFSDWFEMIRIGSDTDIGINRNSSDWLGMNFIPKHSPEYLWVIKIGKRDL